MSKTSIDRFRRTGEGPRFMKLGDALNSPVRYLRADLDAWIASKVVRP